MKTQTNTELPKPADKQNDLGQVATTDLFAAIYRELDKNEKALRVVYRNNSGSARGNGHMQGLQEARSCVRRVEAKFITANVELWRGALATLTRSDWFESGVTCVADNSIFRKVNSCVNTMFMSFSIKASLPMAGCLIIFINANRY